MIPYYDQDGIIIYHGSACDYLDVAADCVISDPPYPNKAGHFDDGIAAARQFMISFECPHWMIFWHSLEVPPVPLPFVAHHIWHRTNTNRPDNYEAIYEFNEDGQERASMVLPYAVIAVGLTGCIEATGHPTQKNVKLMERLVAKSKADVVIDPFMGSGTTLVASKVLGRRAIGIEIDERYCEIAAKRLAQGVLFGV